MASAAVAASAIWLVLVGAYAVGFFRGAGAGGAAPALLFLLAALGPVAAFALGALMLRRAEALRDEAAALRAAIERPSAERASAERPSAPDPAALRAALREVVGPLEARLARIEAAGASAVQTPAAPPPPAESAAPRAAPQAGRARRREAARGQAPLPFADAPDPAAPARPLTWEDVARALDFPRDDRDDAGFAAIEAALVDPDFRALLQAAEDVLTLLAGMGLHMEDFDPEPPSPEAWAAYAEGARGAKAAAIGAVHDEEALALARARCKSDPVFRDAGLVLARRWNGLMARVRRELGSDPLLARLGDTRSGRAFMLMARALGAFD